MRAPRADLLIVGRHVLDPAKAGSRSGGHAFLDGRKLAEEKRQVGGEFRHARPRLSSSLSGFDAVGVIPPRATHGPSARSAAANASGRKRATPCPTPGTTIAHKTGTLHDTLNDVGIVYLGDAPYIISVMTTHLPSLEAGRRFIRGVSRIAYDALSRLSAWRAASMRFCSAMPTR